MQKHQLWSAPLMDLAVWRDFPKGLRVLLLDGDADSVAETKLKLEAMDYIVFPYGNENEALEAISKKAESFHVAVVAVTTSSHGIFRFLEMAKDLPVIAISSVNCLSTMMKCIALGAAEFLQKPLSEEKLRNIWQHVVHKAFNAGRNDISRSLKPIKETIVSIIQLQSDKVKLEIEVPTELETLQKGQESKPDDSEGNDKFPAPSTPQLVKGGRLMDDGCCQDPPNCSWDKGNLDNVIDSTEVRENSRSKSKFADNTTINLPNVVNCRRKVQISNHTEDAAEEEVTSDNGSKTDECSSMKDGCQPSSDMHNEDNIESFVEDNKKKKSFPCSSHSHGNKCNKRKKKVDWTPDLHRRFVQAIEQLGIDQAIPSKILELMKVEGLTRHNVASHLQKYRMHRRLILPKADDWKWQPHADFMSRGYIEKPVMVTPPFHSSCGFRPSQVYPPYWGHPNFYSSGPQVWGPTGFPPWHLPHGNWLWKTHPGNHADAWGCPVVPPFSQFAIPSQHTTLSNVSNGLDANGGRSKASKDFYDFNPADEVIDEVVEEAMSKPWLPLPLGLKPPSIDTVLTELQRQGIRTVPPTHRS